MHAIGVLCMSGAVSLDAYDIRLLEALQQDGRLSQAQLSERVNLSPSQCSRRLQRLQELGVIRAWVAQLNADRLGLGVLAFVSVTLEKHGENPARAFHQAVQRKSQILECYSVTGDDDYLLRVVVSDLKAFSNFLMEELMTIPGVTHIRSTVVLDSIKTTTALPLVGL